MAAPTGLDNPIFEMARLLRKLREQKSELEKQVEDYTARIEKVNGELAEAMVLQDLDRFSLEGKTFFRAVESYPRIIDEEGFFAFLKKIGAEGLIRPTVNFQTLRAWYKDQGMAFEEELKKGLLEVHEKIMVRMRTDAKSST